MKHKGKCKNMMMYIGKKPEIKTNKRINVFIPAHSKSQDLSACTEHFVSVGKYLTDQINRINNQLEITSLFTCHSGNHHSQDHSKGQLPGSQGRDLG